MDSIRPIFEYDDFRKYLKDFYAFKKALKENFSFRMLSRLAGFSSPNFFKLVADGKRNLSSESIQRLIKVLKLKKREAVFFETLVLFNQAKSAQEKSRYFESLQRFKSYRAAHQLQDEQMSYYSHWYIVAIRELVQCPQFQNSPEWIARALTPAISTKQAEGAMRVLESLQLIKKNKSGKFVSTDKVVATSREVHSLAVSQFHSQMMDRATEAMQNIPAHLCDLTSVTLAVEESKLESLKQRISEMRKELLARFDAEGTKRERVYQMNFQLFPLSENINLSHREFEGK